MKKKILAFFLILIISVSFSLTVSAAETEDDHYGEEAYNYLAFINDNFPNRINNYELSPNTDSLRACGSWLQGTMESFGYQTKIYGGTIDNHYFMTYAFTKPGLSPRKIVIGAHYDSMATSGCEDNGTGMALVLELAKRFKNVQTPLTLEFCFFDGEETKGFAGSYLYIEQAGVSDVELYINLDCLGSGDVMRVYGGMYEGDALTNAWGYYMARAMADDMGIPMKTMPEAVTKYRTPTRDSSSDQYYFARNGVPYIYFEANSWVKPDGTLGNVEDQGYYNSADPGFSETNGQIYHTRFDNLYTLESIVPGRIRSHLHDFGQLMSRILLETTEESKNVFTFYTEKPAVIDVPVTVPETTEAIEMTAATEESTTEETESSMAETEMTQAPTIGVLESETAESTEASGSGPDVPAILMITGTVLGGVLLTLLNYILTIGRAKRKAARKRKKRMTIR